MGARPKHTIRDVAQEAGVSLSTVSRVLNGTTPVSDPLRQRVLEAAKRLSYRPSASARSLRTNQTYTLGLLLPDVTLPYFSEIAFGVEDAATRYGYSTFLCNTREDTRREKKYLNLLRQRWVDGLIFSTVQQPQDLLDAIAGQNIPVVQIDRVHDELPIHSIRIDNCQASHTAARYLIECGHRHIAYFMGPASVRPFVERLEGYQKALTEAHIEVDPAWIYKIDGFDTDLGLQHVEGTLWQRWCSYSFSFYVAFGFQAAQRMANTDGLRPTALQCANDAIAVGAIHGLEKCGLRVPDDISVMGFDDVSFAALVKPALSTIAQPKYELGARAVELVIQAMHASNELEPQHITLDVELVVRDSVRDVGREAEGTDEQL